MKPLFASIFTTVHSDLHAKALGSLLPWNWNRFREGGRELLLKTCSEVLGIPSSSALIPFYNARSALYHGLRYLGVGPGDEILMQGYTCISVPNAIIAAGATPIYIDIDPATANIDPDLLRKTITPATKAIFVQHTFGIVANMKEILALCEEHQLLLVEDCAHALGASYNGNAAGTFGDMAIYSFGRDKIITSANGGLLVLKQTSEKLATTIMSSLKEVTLGLQIKNILYLILGWWASLTYKSGLGKLIYYISAKANLFPRILFAQEKTCEWRNFDSHYPHVLAHLASEELSSLEEITRKRQAGFAVYKQAFGDKIVGEATDQDAYLRVIYLTDNPHDLIQQAKLHGIHLGDPRYDKVIAGRGCDLIKAGYTQGSCPQAEALASRTLNLPNHRHMTDADYQRVIAVISGRYT